MSKELDEFYKSYFSRITEIDDTPLVKVIDGGKFKLLSIEEYKEMTNKLSDLEAKLVEKDDQINRLQFELQQALNNSLGNTIKELWDFDKQCKISFAVERLEKVKEWLEPKYFDNEQIVYLTKIVDNQIEELKESKHE